jgi:hypothetical protein
MIRGSTEVRNDYAHGNWNKVKAALQNFDLMDVLRVISNVFASWKTGCLHEQLETTSDA